MKVTATFIKALPVESGASEKGEWVRRTIIVETLDETARKLAIQFSGEDRVKKLDDIKEKSLVEVHFEPVSREYISTDGTSKWMTNLNGWGIKEYRIGQA